MRLFWRFSAYVAAVAVPVAKQTNKNGKTDSMQID